MKMTDAMAGLAFAGILTFSLSLVGCGSQPAPAPQATAAPAQEQPAQTQEQAAPAQRVVRAKFYAVGTMDQLRALTVFMKENGILEQLKELGIQEGDTVRLYGHAFEYYE